MNKTAALEQVLNSPERLGTQFLNDPKTIASKQESASLTDIPHRASAVTPRISDMLTRVEGIQRWGLNE